MQNNLKNLYTTQLSALASNRESIVSNRITAITGLLLCVAVLMMSGCATSGSTHLSETDSLASKQIYQITAAANQCQYLNKEIADILQYAKKFNRSQYAYYYQALSRERLHAIENRAKQADCKYLTIPATTRFHHLASL